jgi:hypothetical protein
MKGRKPQLAADADNLDAAIRPPAWLALLSHRASLHRRARHLDLCRSAAGIGATMPGLTLWRQTSPDVGAIVLKSLKLGNQAPNQGRR